MRCGVEKSLKYWQKRYVEDVIMRTSIRIFLCSLAIAILGRAAEPGVPARDVLVYQDGDRVQGRLLQQEGNILVFSSDRFGILRVPVEGTVVIKAEIPAAPPPASAAPHSTQAAHRSRKAAHADARHVATAAEFTP